MKNVLLAVCVLYTLILFKFDNFCTFIQIFNNTQNVLFVQNMKKPQKRAGRFYVKVKTKTNYK